MLAWAFGPARPMVLVEEVDPIQPGPLLQQPVLPATFPWLSSLPSEKAPPKSEPFYRNCPKPAVSHPC